MSVEQQDAMQAECAHVLQTVHFDGDMIDRITCDACSAELPLPEPAPIKPPRRMLQPRKDQLRERIAALESQLDEATHTIAAMNAETEAAREAFQRLWAETRPTGLRSWWATLTAGSAKWWNRPKAGELPAAYYARRQREKAGGLTGTGDPAMIAGREGLEVPNAEQAKAIALRHLHQSMRPRERLIPITITATGLPTEETRNAAKALANSAHRQVAPDPDHPQGSSDRQAQEETAPDHDQHRTEGRHDAPAVDVGHDPPPAGDPPGTPAGH